MKRKKLPDLEDDMRYLAWTFESFEYLPGEPPTLCLHMRNGAKIDLLCRESEIRALLRTLIDHFLPQTEEHLASKPWWQPS